MPTYPGCLVHTSPVIHKGAIQAWSSCTLAVFVLVFKTIAEEHLPIIHHIHVASTTCRAKAFVRTIQSSRLNYEGCVPPRNVRWLSRVINMNVHWIIRVIGILEIAEDLKRKL
jgi:hypothetical protein